MSGALTGRATRKGQQRNMRRIKTILIKDMGGGRKLVAENEDGMNEINERMRKMKINTKGNCLVSSFFKSIVLIGVKELSLVK